MKTPDHSDPEPRLELTVNEELWKPVAHLDQADPGDRVYSFDRESGSIRFGDGAHGKRPSAGARIQATYRYGAGAGGEMDTGPAITLTWTSESFRSPDFIAAIIEPQANGIVFRPNREPVAPLGWRWFAVLCRNIKKWALRLTCRPGSND